MQPTGASTPSSVAREGPASRLQHLLLHWLIPLAMAMMAKRVSVFTKGKNTMAAIFHSFQEKTVRGMTKDSLAKTAKNTKKTTIKAMTAPRSMKAKRARVTAKFPRATVFLGFKAKQSGMTKTSIPKNTFNMMNKRGKIVSKRSLRQWRKLSATV